MKLLPLSASRLAHITSSLLTIGSQLQPITSHWSSWGCCLVTSEALIFEQSSGCLLQHFYRQSAEWDYLTHSHTHTEKHKLTHAPVQRTPQYAPWWHSWSAARPAGTDPKVLNWDNRPTWYKADLQACQILKEESCDRQNHTNSWILLLQEMCQLFTRQQKEKDRNRVELD